jgi:hypothetical protein
MPPVQAVVSQTKKKNDRLMQLGPVFRRGVVRIRRSHKDFIDQWVSFDYEQKNNRDDLLDAVELALSAAGVLMPIVPIWDQDTNDLRGNSLEQEAWLQILRNRDKKQVFDPELGSQA